MPKHAVDVNSTVMITVTEEKAIQFSMVGSGGSALSLSGDFLLHHGRPNTINLQCAHPFKLVIVDFFDTTPGTPVTTPAGQHGRSCSAAECPVFSGGAQGPVFSSSGASNGLSLTIKNGGNANKGVYKYSLVVDTGDGSVAAIDPQIIIN